MASFFLLTLLVLCIAQSAFSRDWILLSDSNPDDAAHISQEYHDVDPGQCCVPIDLYALSTGQVWHFRPNHASFYQSQAQGRQFNVFGLTPNCAGPPAEYIANAPEIWSSSARPEGISGATMGHMAGSRERFPDDIALGYGDYTLEQQGPIIARYVKTRGQGPVSLMGRRGGALGEWLLKCSNTFFSYGRMYFAEGRKD